MTPFQQFVSDYIDEHGVEQTRVLASFACLMTYLDTEHIDNDRAKVVVCVGTVGEAAGVDPQDLFQYMQLGSEASRAGEDPEVVRRLLKGNNFSSGMQTGTEG